MLDDLTARRVTPSARNRRSVITVALWYFVCAALVGLFVFFLYREAEIHLFRDRDRTRTPVPAYLGIAVQDVTEPVSRALGLSGNGGVLVTEVIKASPADKAGLRNGDVVLRFDGDKLDSITELEKLVAETEPDDTVGVVIERSGQVRTYYVEMESRPSYLMQAALVSQNQDDDGWGCTLAPINPTLTAQLSLPPTIKGVAVVAVKDNGIAATAGIRPGDIIVSVSRTPTPNLASFYKAIENQRNPILEIYRNGETHYIQIKIESAAAPPIATIAGTLTEGATLSKRVAIASNGTGLSAQVGYRFGTAPYFIIADLSTGRYTTIQNQMDANQKAYAIQAAQLVAAQGVGATIAKAYGPQAYDTLKALNITPFVTEAILVADAVNQYRSGFSAVAITPNLPGFSYARSIITTGGGTEDDDEEQSGYKGMPYTIPPKGKYDPSLVPTDQAQLTGGGTEDDDEEQSGYKGMPYTIPPKGKYDPALDPNGAFQTTSGSSQRSDYCYCPICQKLIPHPPSVSCADLTCPDCGTRLRNYESGSALPNSGGTVPSGVVQYPSVQTIQTVPANTVTGSGVSQLPIQGQGQTTTTPLGMSMQTMRAPMMSAAPMSNGGMMSMQSQSRMPSTMPSTNVPMIGTQTNTALPSDSTGLPMQNRPQAQMGGGISSATVPYSQPTTGTLYLNQQTGYCMCPICGQMYEKPPGIPCAALICTHCGSRLVSVNPGGGSNIGRQTVANLTAGSNVAGTTSSRGGNGAITTAGPTSIPPSGSNQLSTTGQTTAGQTVVGQPPAQQTSVGMSSSAGPGIAPPGGGQSRAASSVQFSARNSIGAQPTTTPPIGNTGILTGGKPETIPPMGGQTSAGSTAVGTPTAGMTVAGPSTIPPTSVRPTGSSSAQTAAGTPTAGTLVGGKPETIPPMGGQTSAGSTAAGTPTAGMTVAGPSTIPPTSVRPTGSSSAQTAAGSLTGGQSESIPPIGQTAAGATIVDEGRLPPAGQTTAGSTSSSVGVLQGIIDGECVCPRCGARVPHERGTACYTIPCPSCGTAMVRDSVLSGQITTPQAQTSAGTTTGGSASNAMMPVSSSPETSALTIAGENSGKICIATNGTSMDNEVAPMFDRAPYFLIIELGNSKVVTNPNVEDRIGVGVQSAQLVVSEGANVVITNDISVKALEELSRLRIQVFTGVSGTAKQALSWYQNGRLTPSVLNDDEKKEEHSGSAGKGKESKSTSSSSSRAL